MLRASHILQLIALCLLAVGVVFVHSAGMRIGRPVDASTWVTSRHTLYAALAMLAMFVGSRINIRHVMACRGIHNPLPYLLLLSLGLLMLVWAPGVGRDVGGANRWLSIAGVSFQPSELLKWVMIPTVAWWCTRHTGDMRRFFSGLMPVLGVIAVVCGAIVIEDLGTAALIGAVAVALLVAGGARLWHLAMLAPFAVAMLVAAIFTAPYRVARLTAFLDPWADPAGIGYHPIQSMLAVAGGNVTGRGLGAGVQKFGYLPEDTTDFVFAIVCEELGLPGAVVVIGLFIALLWVGLSIVRHTPDLFGRLFGLGIVLTVGAQAAINLAVVTVVVPTKGIALPLVSAGGTGWVLTGFCLGLLASLDVARRYEQEDDSQYVTAELDEADSSDHRASLIPVA